jgi:hypothetical protein
MMVREDTNHGAENTLMFMSTRNLIPPAAPVRVFTNRKTRLALMVREDTNHGSEDKNHGAD